ncbi:MAG: hypothetical protein KAH31_07280 [Candidatus Sabulitectum sp.]|nr:hypothetical protein [Candidatus Sabulitectum sp.]
MESKLGTDFLVPEVDFVTGIGSVASIYGKYYDYNYSDSTIEADEKAIRSDWRMVGQDILNAVMKIKLTISSNG